jgi:hypothetical protein
MKRNKMEILEGKIHYLNLWKYHIDLIADWTQQKIVSEFEVK